MPQPIGASFPVCFALAALLGCMSVPVAAQSGEPGRTGTTSPKASLLTREWRWNELSRAQQTALAPLQQEWNSIDTVRRGKWIEIADRFPSMTPEERQRVQTRMTQWARLSPKERGEARVHFQELRQVPAAERQSRWERYQALSPEQRAELAQRAGPGEATASPTASSAVGRSGTSPKPKSNIVALPPAVPAHSKPVAPTVVQAAPGATTNLITRQPAPPMHQQPGLPKVTATPGFVDKTTLLPRRGAQAAGVRAASAPASPPAR